MPDRTITSDSLFNGKVACSQYADGYRFSVDAVLLGHFAAPSPASSVLDLGSGCGVIGLILSHRHPAITITCLELQPALLALIQRNIVVNNLEERLFAQQGDVTSIARVLEPESFDLVVCNPPYGEVTRGRLSRGEEQLIARHEKAATVADFVRAAAFAVKNRGRVAFILPASRLTGLLCDMRAVRLEPKRLQMVHSYAGAPAKLVLVEAMKNGGEELQVLAPLFIYQEPDGEYSAELAAMFS